MLGFCLAVPGITSLQQKFFLNAISSVVRHNPPQNFIPTLEVILSICYPKRGRVSSRTGDQVEEESTSLQSVWECLFAPNLVNSLSLNIVQQAASCLVSHFWDLRRSLNDEV